EVTSANGGKGNAQIPDRLALRTLLGDHFTEVCDLLVYRRLEVAVDAVTHLHDRAFGLARGMYDGRSRNSGNRGGEKTNAQKAVRCSHGMCLEVRYQGESDATRARAP